jgi:hypothetical protein
MQRSDCMEKPKLIRRLDIALLLMRSPERMLEQAGSPEK